MGEIMMNRKGKFPEMSCSLPRDAVQSQQHGPHGKHRVGAKLSTGAMSLPRGSEWVCSEPEPAACHRA